MSACAPELVHRALGGNATKDNASEMKTEEKKRRGRSPKNKGEDGELVKCSLAAVSEKGEDEGGSECFAGSAAENGEKVECGESFAVEETSGVEDAGRDDAYAEDMKKLKLAENALFECAVHGKNVTALIFWLKNKCPELWRDKPEAERGDFGVLQRILEYWEKGKREEREERREKREERRE